MDGYDDDNEFLETWAVSYYTQYIVMYWLDINNLIQLSKFMVEIRFFNKPEIIVDKIRVFPLLP